MDIIRFTTGSAVAPRVGVSDGEVVTELGAATVAELLRQPPQPALPRRRPLIRTRTVTDSFRCSARPRP